MKYGVFICQSIQYGQKFQFDKSDYVEEMARGRVSNLVKSLNLVLLIRVPILGRFLHFQSFRATFIIPQLTCKFCYILIIFALRKDLTCHFSITCCLRYQGDRVLVIDILGRFLHFQSFRATFTIPHIDNICSQRRLDMPLQHHILPQIPGR